MKELAPIERLDAVLELIKSNEAAVLESELVKIYVPETSIEELLRIIEKLLDDKYIRRYESDNHQILYYMTFDGYLFHGYKRKKEIDDLTYTIAVENENRTRSYDRRLLLATWCAGIAALLLLGWQIFVYLYPVHADYPYFFWHR